MKEHGYKNSQAEYAALRGEIVSRIGLISQMNHQGAIVMLSSWGTAVALFALSSSGDMPVELVKGFAYAVTIALLGPLLFLYQLHLRSGENLRQIAGLACYIRVFFE